MANFEKWKGVTNLCNPKILPMIKLNTLLGIIIILLIQTAHSQQGLNIQGTSPNLHVRHTVVAKDTWFGLARMYNISAKEIATYNGSSTETPLSLGKELKIPLTASNFSQSGTKAADEVFVPLYHTVQEKEWMYRISVNHNKVPIESLEKWNNISRDNARAGTRLIVGFLKVKQGQSALVSRGSSSVASVTPVPHTKEPPPPPKKESVAIKDEPAKTQETVTKTEEKKSESIVQPISNQTVNFKGGHFKSLYVQSGKSTVGVSGVFKSTSGWGDGKYYALMNNVPVGTIVKVNFPSTNKNIYAKVLGQLPDMKESAGLTIRISDAAATELGAGIGKFSVDVQY